MRFAIVESGGKQYRAVEGQPIDVDRLPVDPGKQFDFERVLLMVDGDNVLVGTPTVSDIAVKATVLDHVKGPKIERLRYRPKKRIRVRGGHRQQYTRLMIDFIGRPGEKRAVAGEGERPEVAAESEAEEAPKAERQARSRKAGAEQGAAPSPQKGQREPAKPAKTRKSTPPKSASKK